MVIERHSFGGQGRHQPREEYLAQHVLEGRMFRLYELDEDTNDQSRLTEWTKHK